jgi:hypothetical protein
MSPVRLCLKHIVHKVRSQCKFGLRFDQVISTHNWSAESWIHVAFSNVTSNLGIQCWKASERQIYWRYEIVQGCLSGGIRGIHEADPRMVERVILDRNSVKSKVVAVVQMADNSRPRQSFHMPILEFCHANVTNDGVS